MVLQWLRSPVVWTLIVLIVSVAHLNPECGGEVMLDVTHGHPAGVERDCCDRLVGSGVVTFG